jgi:hypothetical protein
MKRLLWLLLSVALLFAVIAAAWAFLPPPRVTIVLINASKKPIQSVQIAYGHGWPKVQDVLPFGGVPVGETRTVHYPSPGESECGITVQFADGTEIKGEEGYAEAGYRFTETISDTSIKSERELPRY